MNIRDEHAGPALPGAPCGAVTVVMSEDPDARAGRRVCDRPLSAAGSIVVNGERVDYLACERGHEVWADAQAGRGISIELEEDDVLVRNLGDRWFVMTLMGTPMIWRTSGAAAEGSVFIDAHPVHNIDGIGHSTTISLDRGVRPVTTASQKVLDELWTATETDR